MSSEDLIVISDETSQGEEDYQSEGDTEPESQPKSKPQFAVFQKILAKDNTTPLLYEAIIRKVIYGPKSRNVNIFLIESPEDNVDDATLDTIFSQEPKYCWHYFVHYSGWKATWDRWVDEDQIFPDNEDSRILATRLKEESKCLKKGSSKKKILGVMQRIVRLEQELRDKLARGESIELQNSESCSATDEGVKKMGKPEPKKDVNPKDAVTKTFLSREVRLRRQDLTSRNCSINLPFPLKKVLTDDWEIVTKCDMLHSIPAVVSVMDALNAYYDGKMRVLNADINRTNGVGLETGMDIESPAEEEEKKDEDCNMGGSMVSTEGEDTSDDDDEEMIERNRSQKEWKDMVEGICMFFDEALPKRLLFRHEIPQCMLLEETHEKRYCELYPCEYLIRMCIKLPDMLEEAKQIPEDEKSKILFKIGDLLRFLNRNQDDYFLQRYRKATNEENTKATRLKKKLGLDSEEEGISDEESVDSIEWGANSSRKRSVNDSNGARQRRKIT